jgi:hypothetical protein
VALNPVNCSVIGSDGEFKLICLVLHMPFPISISIKKDKTVYDLQIAIKKRNENSLAGIDSDALNI